MSNQISVREASERSAIEVQRQVEKADQLARQGREPSLVDYVLDATERASARAMVAGLNPAPAWTFGVGTVRRTGAGIDGLYELSELCRQASGIAPEGVWVPLALCGRRTLSLASAGLTAVQSTQGVQRGSSLLSGLFPENAVMSHATIVSGLQGGRFDFLAEDTSIDTSGDWKAEVAVQSEREPALRAVPMEPTTVRGHVDVSLLALKQRKVDLEVALRQIFARRTLVGIDKTAYVGAGGDAPTGLLNHSGLQVVAAGTNGAAPTWAHLCELEYQVGTRMGPSTMAAPHFVMSPYLKRKLRTTAKSAGLDFILGNDGSSVLGAPIVATTHSPDNLTKGTASGVCSALLYGDISELILAFWGPAAVDVVVDPVSRADRGQVRVHFRADVAVAPRNPGAFAAYKDLLGA